MKAFIIRWLCTTLAVAVAAWITAIDHASAASLFGVALLLGLVNALIRPVLLVLSLPFIVVTLGFFILIVNTLMFWLAVGLVPGISVDGFWQAFFAALIVSIVNWALSSVFQAQDGSVHISASYGVKQANARVIEEKPRE